MPNIKSSVLRYLLIDTRLRKDPKPGHPEIQAYLEEQFAEISSEKMLFTRFTIKKDVKDMKKQFGAPVGFSFQENSYRYTDDTYTFLNLPPAILERITLHLKLQYLWSDKVNKNIKIVFEDLPLTEGYNYIPIIAEALSQKKALSIRYRAAIAKRSGTLIIHPQAVREYQKKFFLIGIKDKERELRSFEVSCILEKPFIMATEAIKVKDSEIEAFNIETGASNE